MSTLSPAAELFMAPIRQRPKDPDALSSEAPKPGPVGPADETANVSSHYGFVLNPKPTGKERYQFRLMEGAFVDYEGEKTPKNRDGQRRFGCDKQKGVFPIIGTDQDLSIFNGKHPGMKKKFERISMDRGDVIVQTVDPTERQPGETVSTYLARLKEIEIQMKKQVEVYFKAADTLTLEQIQEFAAAEEIDLRGAKTVEEARKVFKAALKG